MTKPKFTVIEGGLSAPKETQKKYFMGAYVTDTRLMGVMGLYIHWRIPDQPLPPDFHQFFYLDAEEFGFETYKSITGNNVEEIAAIEQALIGGLGGRKVEVTEREARYLLCEYARFNQRHNLSLPEGREEYEFLIEHPTVLNPNEQKVLIEKQCDRIVSSYQTINYFLMRCFGHDYEAASWLSEGDFPLDIYGEHPAATLCKNTIDEDEFDSGTYLCESLIEYNDQYTLLVSELTVNKNRVTSFEKCSGFPISPAEAAMMLSRPEFVTVYEVLMPPDDFSSSIGQMAHGTMMTPHENGKLFLAFNNNNNHVNKRVFRLSEDVFGLYYITDYGQLIVSSYSLSGIHALERDLRKSVLAPYLMATAKYEFKEPILYEFIQSDFEDFNEFLDFIRNE